MTTLSSLKSLGAAAVLGLACAASSAHAATYILDDGIINNDIGIGSGSPGLLLNAFQTGASGDAISAVQIAFSSNTPLNIPFEIILFSDPNGDGSPRDGIELARASAVTPAVVTPGAFVNYNFTSPISIAAGQWFFAGHVEPSVNLSVGTDAAGGNFSYAAWNGTDPITAANFGTFASFGAPFARDYMVRAVGVPEPSAALLLGACVLGGLSRRTRR